MRSRPLSAVSFATLLVGSFVAVVGCSSASGAGFDGDTDAGASSSDPSSDPSKKSDAGGSTPASDGGTSAPKSDAGSSAVVDAGIGDAGSTEDAGGADAGSDAAPPPSTSTDPFDPAACVGAPITFAAAAAKFPSGASTASLGTYKLMMRTRNCTAVSGCSVWSAPSQALAYRAHGNTTGDFPLGGVGYLEVMGSTISAEFADSSTTTGNESMQFLSTVTSGPIDFAADSHGYMYTALYELYVPPSPQDEWIDTPFTLVVTDHCAVATSNVVDDSVSSLQTQWAALVRY